MASSSSVSDVKSTAVVKYSSVKWPLQFSTIGLNTDLNHPPTDPRGLTVYFDRSIPANSNFSKFLSVNMAHSYQDLVGQVDVISSSKSIKSLLKMPFSSSPQISIMVHRLGKTLLLEDFDIVKHIIRKQAEEWTWLRNYYYDVIAKEEKEKQSKCLDGSPANREAILNNMYMNLIRHSFAASENGEACTVVAAQNDPDQLNSFRNTFSKDLKGFHHETLWKFQDISMLIDSDLPIFGGGSSRRPCISLRLRDSRSPPINILTGLDYWLDNLMSNVPEVAMCYHINGFVQKYEVMKTEDIPNLENSSFDPNEVLDIAQNIMSFIKRNAAVEGHTYWLYKSENDEMVKLYDLTDLCKDKIVTGENPFTVPVGLLCHRVARNLRTSGQRRNADSRAMFENCLRLLDDTKYCQECADAHFHLSDMWVPDKSINDIWQEKRRISEPPSDLYDEDSTESDDSSKGDKQEGSPDKTRSETVKKATRGVDSSNEKEMKNSVALKELVVRGMVKKKAWQTVQANRIAGTTDERCREALSHIRKGLNCIDKDLIRVKNESELLKQQPHSPSRVIPLPYAPLNINTKDNNQSSKGGTPQGSKEQEPQMCNPLTPIPMPYHQKAKEEASRNTSKASSSVGTSSGTKETRTAKTKPSASHAPVPDERTRSSTANKETSEEKSWHFQAKFQLLKKASITYFVLAKEFFEIKKFGHTLRHLRYAIHCFEALFELEVNLMKDNQICELQALLFYLAGQTRISLYPNYTAARHDFEELGEEEAAILHSAQAVVPNPKMAWMYEWSPSLHTNLLAARDLFKRASQLPAVSKKPISFQTTLRKDLGACLMNLGSVQTDICKDKILKNDEPLDTIQTYITKCMENFTQAISIFNTLGERNMAAHNYSNMGYMHNLAAAVIHNRLPKDVILHPEEREHVFKAIEYYEKSAKSYEGDESYDPYRQKAYETLYMQYYQMGYQYTDKVANCTDEDLENLKDYLQKSLKYCTLAIQEPFLMKSTSTAANNCLNLAYVVEAELFRTKNMTRRKHLKQKLVEYFLKAIELYKLLKWPMHQIFTVTLWMEGILSEAKNGAGFGSINLPARKKCLRNILCHISDLKQAIDDASSGKANIEERPVYIFHKKDFTGAVDDMLGVLNQTFSAVLKWVSAHQQVKDLYKRTLRMTAMKDDLVSLYPLLSDFLSDLKSALASDPFH
ncbi:hypothetical protein EGW08_001270 [Elysia chlorotica]|uniref:EDRF1 N-terminal domain-containing protein n=1 Tax=Elysia chlorotica TaxID=188477 RepID=A0A3S1BT68_ELYCH|nr:hypothetical protein EGW08_001270 [Elysia chlorotica]